MVVIDHLEAVVDIGPDHPVDSRLWDPEKQTYAVLCVLRIGKLHTVRLQRTEVALDHSKNALL